MWADIFSDHYPLIAKVKINRKAELKTKTTRKKYIKCTDDQRKGYNKGLINNGPNANLEGITSWINTTGTEYIPESRNKVLDPLKFQTKPRI